MKIEHLQEKDLPDVQHFLSQLPLTVPTNNFSQFWVPRKGRVGYEIGLMGLKDKGRLIGTLGYIQVPLRLAESHKMGRWPTNYFLLQEYRRKGLGGVLLAAMCDAGQWGLVSGGTTYSTAVFEKSGWHLIGNLSSCRWFRPCMNPSRLIDRLRVGSRRMPLKTLLFASRKGSLSVRRIDEVAEGIPWESDDRAEEDGVPRNMEFLEFAFGNALKDYHVVYTVFLKEKPVGYFVLAAQADRFPFLATQIMDCDSLPGEEDIVLWAASQTGLTCSDLVRLRIMGQRFVRALDNVPGARWGVPDVPFRVLPPRGTGEHVPLHNWRVTYGDHDEYRNYPHSQRWE
jgi:hypothetical protein